MSSTNEALPPGIRLRLSIPMREAGRLTWSPDGRWLAVPHAGKVSVWDASIGQKAVVLPGKSTFGVSFSPDGTQLITKKWPGHRTAGSWPWEEMTAVSRCGTLRHEIALQEQAEDGPHLVFPSQFTREWPEAPAPQGQAVIFAFDGPIQNIYATLVVRLAHSGSFQKEELWKNTALFRGRAHLERRALPDAISRRRIFTCAGCDTMITDQQTRRRREMGHTGSGVTPAASASPCWTGRNG
jgi:hypothetical protein